MIARPALCAMTLATAFCLLAACHRTPSFDEKYDAQTKALHGSAKSIEAEVANQISGADAASRAVQDANNGAKLP